MGARLVSSDDIGGTAEVAALCRVARPTVSNWYTRRSWNFPAPVARVAASAIWDLSDVRTWMDTDDFRTAYAAAERARSTPRRRRPTE